MIRCLINLLKRKSHNSISHTYFHFFLWRRSKTIIHISYRVSQIDFGYTYPKTWFMGTRLHYLLLYWNCKSIFKLCKYSISKLLDIDTESLQNHADLKKLRKTIGQRTPCLWWSGIFLALWRAKSFDFRRR